MKIKNKVVGFVGPSGVGKTSFAIRLVRQHKFGLPTVATTRRKRADDDDRYKYVSEVAFLQMIGEGIFLEWDKYANYFYGTYLKNVEDMANSRLFKGVILDLTPKGCQQVKEIMPSSIIIALLPDDPAWLIKRLLSRGTQSEKEIRARTKLLGGYLEMINQIGFCEKVYVGFSPDSWDSTFDAIEKIIRG